MSDYPTLKKIFGAEIIQGMSRGRIIVDENLIGLVDFLKDKNIRVQTPYRGQSDQDIRNTLIGNRIFVTNNPKDFTPYAAETETWIISTENVRDRLIDEDLAELISRTLRDMGLFSRGVTGGLLITLRLDAKPLVRKVEG